MIFNCMGAVMGGTLGRAMFLLFLLLALVCIGVPSSWIADSVGIAQADEITIRRDDGTEESFRVSHDLIEEALMLLVRFSPFVLPSWEGKVVGITRADEISVKKNDETEESVRLYGIYAPIDPNPFGKEAAAYTTKMVLGKTVEVQPLLLPDPRSRVIAWVWVNGECLNKELLKIGMAWWYRKYVPWEKELAQIEAEARVARAGLWGVTSPVPPWEVQAIPEGQGARLETDASPGPRGQAREKVMSEVRVPRKLLGDAGSVRRQLLNSKGSDEKEPSTDRLDSAP